MQNLVRATGRTRLVSERPDRGQPEPRLGGLPRQLGIHAGRLAAPAGGLAVRSGALAGAGLRRTLSRRRPSRAEREPIPPAYATELQTVINALNDLKQAPRRVGLRHHRPRRAGQRFADVPARRTDPQRSAPEPRLRPGPAAAQARHAGHAGPAGKPDRARLPRRTSACCC